MKNVTFFERDFSLLLSRMETTDAADTCSKQVCSAEAKTAQRWITDMFTRVHTSCDIPVNAVFGPCELQHTSVYDSIAFIALKSMDRRTAPYIKKQVDTSANHLSADGPVWLRLVQSARCPAEQNLEAYVKNGQLFYRSLKWIEKDEELLVWYSKDLATLLLLNPLHEQRKGATPYICPNCNHSFESEFPLLAHRRFLCTQRLGSNGPKQNSSSGREDYISPGSKAYISHIVKPESSSCGKQRASLDGKPGTDFHNLARDMERKTDSTLAQNRNLKRKHLKVEEDDISCDLQQPMARLDPLIRGGPCDSGMSTQHSFSHQPSRGSSSLSLVTESESRNAFSLPSQPAPTPVPTSILPKATLLLGRTDPTITSLSTGPHPFHTPPIWSKTPAFFLQTQAHAKALLRQSHTFLGHTPTKAQAHAKGLLSQALPSPDVLLSSSLSPLRLQGQNWCARCRLSFRLTADLVAHMRSVHHHQGALSSGLRTDRIAKEEKRHCCPICKEVFRQRHHLARHLAAHT